MKQGHTVLAFLPAVVVAVHTYCTLKADNFFPGIDLLSHFVQLQRTFAALDRKYMDHSLVQCVLLDDIAVARLSHPSAY